MSFILISIFLVVSSVLISSLTLKTKIKDLSLISYGYDSFLAPSIERVFSNEISSIFIGIGPYPKLYLQQLYGTPEHNQLFKLVYDNWLFGIVFQLGVFVAGFFFLVLVKVFNMISNKAVSEERLVLGVAFISLIGFSHGTFIIDRLFIMKATFLLAACVVRPNELNRG